MNKTILIATDYSLESLSVLKKVLKEKETANDGIKYNIMLVTGYDMGDSIRDLLFTTKTMILNKVRTQEFYDACSIINNKYPNIINKIVFDVFTGSMQRAFNNYIEAANIEEAYFSSNLKTKARNGKFDLIPYIKKSKILAIQDIHTEVFEAVPEKGRLAEVFI